eukprot:TRINITY_DN135121_c3_g1_i1.p2 TRINITY_DN135121_c3_g1~~TRINITY_DN135121_c3_g1_i1.p2  ORF type:complete len:519 (-),score=37.37 TRINITY_DN135121_c3_g1_i1:686-2242(-)
MWNVGLGRFIEGVVSEEGVITRLDIVTVLFEFNYSTPRINPQCIQLYTLSNIKIIIEMNDTLNPPRSSFLAFAQSRALKESEATEAWQRLTEQERNDFVKTYWDTQARALDQGGRIKRKNPPKKFPQLILFFGLLAAFAAVGYWSYINFQPKFTPWDWSVIFIDESYTLPAEPMIHSRSVMLLEREEPFDSKMELGRGIDLNNNVLAEVVNFEAEAQGLIQPEMKTFLEVISEEKQRSNIIKEMAHASIPTKGLGGGIEFLAEVEANETSMYIIMATTVTIRKTRVKGADLKPHIKALAMNISLHNFISLYGTHYISGYTSAAQFIGVIEIRTENAKDKFQVKAALNSTGFPNALAALEIGLEQRKVAHRKNVRMYVKGVNIQKTPMSVQELLAAHEEFIMETRKAPAMPVAVTCSPFSTLPAVQSSKEFLEALENFTVGLICLKEYQVTKGRIEFDDKTYEGFIEKDVPEGYGVMRYDDGEFYEGAWKRGQRSGYGTSSFTYRNRITLHRNQQICEQ